MKHTIFLVALLSSGYAFSMDNTKGPTIINNQDRFVLVRYQPRKEETRIVVSKGEWNCYINKSIDSKKLLVLPPLLTPYISLTIDGFDKLENLPIGKTHEPLTIHPERNNEITITQGIEVLAILSALTNIPKKAPELPLRKKKEESDEEFCILQ